MRPSILRAVIDAILATVLTLSMTLPAMGGEGTKPVQKYAMLVGINNYAKPFGKLEFCQNDAMGLRKQLLSIGFPEVNIVQMCDGTPEPRYLPSKSNIIKELDLLLAMAEKEDLVLLAFSGHGVHVDGVSYLCPFDAKLEKPSETMISLDELYERLQECKASQKVLLVDACRNEPLTKGFRAPGGLKGFADDVKEPPNGIWMLTSCGPGQWSAEDSNLKHGVFMYYVMESLSGKADQECAGNHDSKVSVDEVFSYANQKTMNHVRQSHGIVQKPMREGKTDSDYVIVDAFNVLNPSPGEKDANTRVLPVGPREGVAPGTRSGETEYPLLAQANTFLRQVDYTKAIEAYSAIIEDSSLPIELRHEARKGRSIAYVGRGDKSDLDNAMVDQQATGLAGIQLTVRKESSPLQIGTDVKGTVIRNQIVLVTLSEGDWLWVQSVNGDSTRQGYLRKDAVLEKHAATSVPAVTSTPRADREDNSYNRARPGQRPPSIWQTPEWESLKEIREKRARGELR